MDALHAKQCHPPPSIVPVPLPLPHRSLTFTFISVSFDLWSTKINQDHLDDDGFGAICGSLVGSEVGTQLKAMIFSLSQNLSVEDRQP